jgi:hypothetical protein
MMPSHRNGWAVGLLLGLVLMILFASSARAQVETGFIVGDPLKIQVSGDGALQVWHKLYTEGASFGSFGSRFFIIVNDSENRPQRAYTELIEQQPTTGRGTRGDPFRSVLHYRATMHETVLDVTQTVMYVNGASSFQLEWRIVNTDTARICLKTYHAADLYFANDDYGIGYYNAKTGSVGGYNREKDWFMVFTPVNPATHYEETYYGTIWDRAGSGKDLSDTISSEYIDNGAALQWDFCLAGGESKTISDVWSFGVSEGAIIAEAEQAAGAGDAYGGGTRGPLGISATRFRAVEPGSPALTTSIPTPNEITLTPKVMGTNLIWAALATFLFTIASEILNRTLDQYEAFFTRLFKPLKRLAFWRKKGGLAERLGRPNWYEWVKLVFITVFYGIIFSTLDRTWNPLSFNGIWLFLTMAIAFGVVGLVDDIVRWRTARRWQLPTRISIKPGNLILALFSALFSRTLVLTPGVLFGTPEAFEIDENVLDNKRKNRLLTLAALVLLAILLVSWLPTILSSLALTAGAALPDKIRPFLMIPVASLQSLLLLVFAVTVQNIFLHMLALPDTIGEMLKQKSKILWFIGLVASSFIFLQTLLNPNGDLARSLQTSNVRVYVGTIFIFLLFTILMRVLLKRFRSKDESHPAAPGDTGGFIPIGSNPAPANGTGGFIPTPSPTAPPSSPTEDMPIPSNPAPTMVGQQPVPRQPWRRRMSQSVAQVPSVTSIPPVPPPDLRDRAPAPSFQAPPAAMSEPAPSSAPAASVPPPTLMSQVPPPAPAAQAAPPAIAEESPTPASAWVLPSPIPATQESAPTMIGQVPALSPAEQAPPPAPSPVQADDGQNTTIVDNPPDPASGEN